MRFKFLGHLLLLLCLTAGQSVLAQGTAFTYQGRLQEAGQGANGLYDFIFSLYADSNAGVPLVSGYAVSGVPVSNGLFTATMDFGPGVLTGADRWLGITVRSNGAGAYELLSPRQKLTPAPYAVLAGSVAGGGLSGSYSNAVSLTNAANQFVGIFGGNGGGLSNVNAASLGGLTASGFWQLGGNTATSGQFLGTINNQPLELYVDGQRALRLEFFPSGNPNEPNVIGGSAGNWVPPGVTAATIAGGGARNFAGLAFTNSVSANYGTVSGGMGNLVDGPGGAIGGGVRNEVDGPQSFVGGGQMNLVGGFNTESTIAGGFSNAVLALSHFSTIAGGATNLIAQNAPACTIGGGAYNKIQTNAAWATISGGAGNAIQTNAYGSFIGGGSGNLIRANSQFATLSGGSGNSISLSAPGSTIAGGNSNAVGATANAVIGGGSANLVGDLAFCAAVLSGCSNQVQTSASYSVNAGGLLNSNTGPMSSIPGGDQNVAALHSLAAGHRAKALQQGDFVWADAQEADFTATANNQFLVRAQGGVGINTASPEAPLHVAPATNGAALVLGTDAFAGGYTALQMDLSSVTNGYARIQAINRSGITYGNLIVNPYGGNVGIGKANPATALDVNGTVTATAFNPPSDRNLKENFSAVDPAEVLDKVTGLTITRWNFKTDPDTTHVGPMAQDFYAAFGLGTDDRHIATVDADGIALAAIQGLNKKLQDKEAEIKSLNARLEKLEQLLREK